MSGRPIDLRNAALAYAAAYLTGDMRGRQHTGAELERVARSFQRRDDAPALVPLVFSSRPPRRKRRA